MSGILTYLLWSSGIYFGTGFLLGCTVLLIFAWIVKRAGKGRSTYREIQILSDYLDQFAKPGISPTNVLVALTLCGFPLLVFSASLAILAKIKR